MYFKINHDLKKCDKNGKRSIGQLNYYSTFIYTICIYCTMTMAEVSFLTVRGEVMSLKRFYLRIYNYSVQIKFLSKNYNYLTVYKRVHEKIFVNLCYFSFMRKRLWRKLEKIGDIPLTCTLKEILFNPKRSFYYSYQHTFCINNTHSLFMFCIQKHLSDVTHKRTSSGDKDFLLHLAN